jgi:hypothetical protein
MKKLLLIAMIISTKTCFVTAAQREKSNSSGKFYQLRADGMYIYPREQHENKRSCALRSPYVHIHKPKIPQNKPCIALRSL